MLERLRSHIAYKQLKRHQQGEKASRLKSLRSAQTVGLIYNVEKLSWKEVTRMIHFFEEKGKKVTTLGYLNEKELNHNYTPNFKHMFFCKKDLNFWRIPQQQALQSFTGLGFDFLINLDVEGEMVLQAVSAFSKAETRIGMYQKYYEFCQDFMVKAPAENGVELFEHIKKYMK